MLLSQWVMLHSVKAAVRKWWYLLIYDADEAETPLLIIILWQIPFSFWDIFSFFLHFSPSAAKQMNGCLSNYSNRVNTLILSATDTWHKQRVFADCSYEISHSLFYFIPFFLCIVVYYLFFFKFICSLVSPSGSCKNTTYAMYGIVTVAQRWGFKFTVSVRQ